MTMKHRPDRARVNTEHDSTLRRLNRGLLSGTVSYVNEAGERVTRVGRGLEIAAQIAEADAQLPPGEWTRCAVSRPTSIYNDVVGRLRDAHHGAHRGGHLSFPKYEGRTVRA